MFRYIGIILIEFQSCTSLKLHRFYILRFIKNCPVKIFVWLLLIKCSLYDFFLICAHTS